MLRLFIFSLFSVLVNAEEITVNLDDVELPERVVKILERHQEKQAEASQDYREEMDRIKADTSKRLERELKRARDLEALAIQAKIDAISNEGAVDIFGNPIKAPAPDLIQAVLDGHPFHCPGVVGVYTVNGESVSYSRGGTGTLTVEHGVVSILWHGSATAQLRLDEYGKMEYTRTNGQVVVMELYKED